MGNNVENGIKARRHKKKCYDRVASLIKLNERTDFVLFFHFIDDLGSTSIIPAHGSQRTRNAVQRSPSSGDFTTLHKTTSKTAF